MKQDLINTEKFLNNLNPLGLEMQPVELFNKGKFKMNFLTNWKTTLAGVAALITGIVAIVNGNMQVGITGIIAGIGLILGKDFNSK